jgi:C4-dicarboxylate transporter DctM subunit
LEPWVWQVGLIGLTLIIVLFSGIPVAFGIGFIVLVYSIVFWGPQSFTVISGVAFDITSKYEFISIPLFILMAELLIHSGAGKDAFEAANKWLGRVPGGLAVSGVAASAFMSSLVGISAAIPEMERHKYSRKLAAGSIAAGGTLGILIPPSVSFVLYGTITETSIGQLFLAGFIPGIIMAIVFAAWIMLYVSFKPHIAPRAAKFPVKDKFKSMWRMGPLIVLALFMLIALYTGIATPSEIASIGVVASLLLLVYYRQLKVSNVKEAALGTVKTTCMVMWIAIAASSFGHIMSYIGAASNASQFIIGLTSNKYAIIGLMVFILLVMGCFLDPVTMIVITTPVFIPTIKALGFNPVWFGVLFIITLEMGYITPPFGFNLFIMRSIAPNVSMDDVIVGVTPFIVCQLVVIGILLAFPDLALILPRAMM